MSSFKLADDKKVIGIDPKCHYKVMRISTNLPPKLEVSLMGILPQNIDTLMWKPTQMLGILHDMAKHFPNIYPEARAIQQ